MKRIQGRIWGSMYMEKPEVEWARPIFTKTPLKPKQEGSRRRFTSRWRLYQTKRNSCWHQKEWQDRRSNRTQVGEGYHAPLHTHTISWMSDVKPADRSLQAHYCYQKAWLLRLLLTVKDELWHMTNDGKSPHQWWSGAWKSMQPTRTNPWQSGGSKQQSTNVKDAWLKLNEGGCSRENIEIGEKPNQFMPDGPEMTGDDRRSKTTPMTANHGKLQPKMPTINKKATPWQDHKEDKRKKEMEAF